MPYFRLHIPLAYSQFQTISKKEIISDLEDRYIEILRSKIARIESEVGGLKPKPDSSSAAEVCDTSHNQVQV